MSKPLVHVSLNRGESICDELDRYRGRRWIVWCDVCPSVFAPYAIDHSTAMNCAIVHARTSIHCENVKEVRQ